MNRVNKILSHISDQDVKLTVLSKNSTSSRLAKSDDDIVIVSALRTAIGRARKGSFKDTHPGVMLAACLKGVVDKSGVDPSLVGDIVIGNVSEPAGFATQARMAMLIAGFPDSVPVTTCNRQCSSGLQAFAHTAAGIRAGYYDMAISGGVEHMSTSDMMNVGDIADAVFDSEAASKCLTTMGQTSENVAEKFGITRQQQDQMACESHRRALAAQARGHFDDEIVPVTTIFEDKNGDEKEITVTKDDGPRPGTTMEKIGKMRAAFKEGGSTTAANASQMSDGAAAVLATTRKRARELGLPIIGRFHNFAAVGCDPLIMGIGPAVAIPEVLKKTGLQINDIDAWEINEAFASQATYCCQKLGLDMKKVNPVGGAIALGHPLGCTGSRQIATLLNYLHKTNGRYGVVSMCIGTGMGAAAVFERE